ncbi:hypothetical protein AAF712_011041 [Marasmius tenuissimus]|uniref:F-box domain-containing protein n=1 Tax=Marasmius tenuissimus TaxID=585030 RepID=A0ABR2ZMB1_9AGAR
MKNGEEKRQVLDGEIEGLRKQLARLEVERSSVDNGVTCCQSVLLTQTLRKLPVEIWELIFTQVCEAMHEYTFDFSYDPTVDLELQNKPILKTPVITLSHVCSRWNAVVKTCPRLWSSIRVDIYELNLDLRSLLSMYLENSGGFPLRLCLSEKLFGGGPYPSLNDIQCTWNILAPILRRCKEFVVDLESFNIPQNFSSDLTFPRLETYREDRYLVGGLEEALSYALQFHAPQLTTASLWHLHSHISYPHLTTLTIFILGEDEVDTLIAFLRTCQSLESLTIDGLDGDPREDQEAVEKSMNLMLPSLHTFSLLDDKCSYTTDNGILLMFLSCLTMPSLVVFRMDGYDWPSSHTLFTLLRHSPSLESVELSFTRGSTGESGEVSAYPLFPFLEMSPRLKHFDFTLAMSQEYRALPLCCQFIDEVILLLVHKLQPGVQSSTAAFLPLLQSLHLNILDLGVDMQEKALKAISSRPGLQDCKIVGRIVG